jgi:hypothetical protein
MDTFTTFNQFDERFKNIGTFGPDRTACPLFALITAKNFMDIGDISKKQHENNIYAAVTNYITKNVPKYMTFEELVSFTGGAFGDSDIGATTPELLTQHVVGYEHIFKPDNYDQNYCAVLLKNRNYIAVMYEHATKRFAVRDSHETDQWNFNSYEDMLSHLNKTYQFDQMTIAGGVLIPEFSNIEFLTVDIPFELTEIDPHLYDDEDQDPQAEQQAEQQVQHNDSNDDGLTEYEKLLKLQLELDGDF